MNEKKYIIFAGVNGSGKSTLYTSIIENFTCMERVNSDEILKANKGDWRDIGEQARAMKEAVRRINHYLDAGISFNQETTLTGHNIINNIARAKERGYVVEMYYVGVENVDIAIKRVNERVKRGGHGISEDDIRRRYEKSLDNLKKVIPMCDKVAVYDNTIDFERVALFKSGNPILVNNRCKWFKTLMKEPIIKSKINSIDLER